MRKTQARYCSLLCATVRISRNVKKKTCQILVPGAEFRALSHFGDCCRENTGPTMLKTPAGEKSASQGGRLTKCQKKRMAISTYMFNDFRVETEAKRFCSCNRPKLQIILCSELACNTVGRKHAEVYPLISLLKAAKPDKKPRSLRFQRRLWPTEDQTSKLVLQR